MKALRSPPTLVAAMLLVAALLALAMSLTEGINPDPGRWQGPPDEHGHRSAARYYIDHWLPPAVGDPASLESYSRDYGYSYLNDPDPVYFFAGKFAALVSPVVSNHELAFRLFDVMLLAILAILCLGRPAAWLAFAPLALSPQLWYIFSYFNGDAFPLFLSVLVAWQVAEPQSLFNRYLDAPGVLRMLRGAALLALLLALLALSKKNYMAFLALVPAAIALARLGAAGAVVLALAAIGAAAYYLRWLPLDTAGKVLAAATFAIAAAGAVFFDPSTRRERGRIVAKLAALAALAFALTLLRPAWDAWVNGSLAQKQKAQNTLQEAIAKPEYKPSQIYGSKKKADATYYGLQLRARGTPLKDLFNPFWNWHNRTFASATGSYGWLTINGPFAYYALMTAAYLALMGVYGWAVVRSRDAGAMTGFAIVGAFAVLTVAVAIHHSWVDDFQAQGRYLFPIVGMLGIGLMAARRWVHAWALTTVIAACFALSAYSFVFIGLAQVQRSF